ncbi:MAG: UDP-N-acetylglucosamine--N-acetylmuramyl-(pentapeptide) pyrophosphoryl-undecaprenol N-acetylglucosamine transferase [Candidatus Parcubacteria bacterium]|nr:UDP-N-acetylglucosamine--N-acetylmuramyl-(pentapeptide) pyrophosphoryl-undecaprenol N-acetylglucosamine transferase [Candidatus Parcubacteria bacterium]
MSHKNIKIILTGGGTGGHIYPLVAVARELNKIAKDNNLGISLIYIGPADYTTKSLLAEGVRIRPILAGKLRRYFSLVNLVDAFKTFLGLWQAFFWTFIYMPDAVFSKGGFGAFPISLIASLFHISFYEHESDTMPGLVNNLFKKSARKIFVSFRAALTYFPGGKTYLSGSPIRDNFYEPYNITNCKNEVGLKLDKPVVLFLGGSQGAQFINNLVIDSLEELLPECQIVHQTGPNNFEMTVQMAEVVFQGFGTEQSQKLDYHPVAFLDEQELTGLRSLYKVLGSADLVVTRSGSGSIAELSAMGKPMILIPLSNASQNHQWKNASAVANEGAGIILEQENLKSNTLTQTIINLLHSPDRLNLLAVKSKTLGLDHKKAAQTIAETIVQDIFS